MIREFAVITRDDVLVCYDVLNQVFARRYMDVAIKGALLCLN